MKTNTSTNVREGVEIRRRFHRRTAWSNKSEEVEALVDTDPLRRSVGSRRGELDRWMRSAGSDTRWRKAMGMLLCKSVRFRPFLAPPPPPPQQQQIAGAPPESMVGRTMGSGDKPNTFLFWPNNTFDLNSISAHLRKWPRKRRVVGRAAADLRHANGPPNH